MADLKIKVLVNLAAGFEKFKAGSVFEGTLDKFPEPIKQAYLNRKDKPGIIEILVDAKGREVPKEAEQVTGRLSTKITPIGDKSPKDPSKGAVGKQVPPVGDVNQTLSGTEVVQREAKKKVKKAPAAKVDSGASTNDSEGIAEQAKKKKPAIKRPIKAPLKVKIKK